MPPRPRKRPRKAPPTKDKDGEKRPAPPPPAPPSLIRLLKKDKNALEYFRALQVNLNYDVEKWKQRSNAYREELEEIKRVQRQTELLSSEVHERKQRDESDGDFPDAKAVKQQPETDAAPATTKEEIQIEDSAFDFEVSSYEDEDEIDNNDDYRGNGGNPKPLLSAAAGKQTARKSYKFSVDDDDDDDDEKETKDSDNKKESDESDNEKETNDSDTDNADVNNKSLMGHGRTNGAKISAITTLKHRPNLHKHVDSRSEERGIEAGPGSRTTGVNYPSKLEEVPKRIRIGWKFLRKAEEYLNEIGIVLATTIVINEYDDDGDDNNDGNNIDDSANPIDGGIDNLNGNSRNNVNPDDVIEGITIEHETRTHTSYIRRSNNAVLGDIVQTIKDWTKLKYTATFPLDSPESLANKNAEVETTQNGHETKRRSRTFKHQYAAFLTREMIPCFVPVPERLLGDGEYHRDMDGEDNKELEPPTVPQHPSVRGVEILLKALALIDAFGPVLDDIEIETEIDSEYNGSKHENGEDSITSYFAQLVRLEGDKANTEVDRSSFTTDGSLSSAKLFVTGMKKRYSMVRSFAKSLEGEICDAWPVQDRFNRIGNLTLHYDKNHSDENGNAHGNGESPEDATKKTGERRKVVMDSKNSLRLATMVDRCILARIVASIYVHRSDPSAAIEFLFRYILTTAPSLQQEDYPKHQPALSLLVVETILNTPFHLDIDNNDVTGRTLCDYLLDNVLMSNLSSESIIKNGNNSNENNSHPLFESFHLALATSATICRLRKTHEDTRISEPGFVEEAAYQRMTSHLNRSHTQLLNIESMTMDNQSLDNSFLSYTNSCRRLTKYFLEEFTSGEENDILLSGYSKRTSTVLTWMLPITMIVQGDGQELRNIFSDRSESFLSSQSQTELFVLECCSKAMRQIEIRNVDSYRAVISSPTTTNVTTVTESTMTRFVDSIIAKKADEYRSEDDNRHASLNILLGICHELADGENALRLMQWWLKSSSNEASHEKPSPEVQDTSHVVDYWSALPMVRVINLERRQDRMASFLSQAMHAGLWAIRGVIPPDRWQIMKEQQSVGKDLSCSEEGNDLTSYIGTYAIDGSQESPAQVERKLMQWLELGEDTNRSLKRVLDSLVKPQWRPNDLRAFDLHASDDPTLIVSLNPSEKACALSHIATWKGIASSSWINRFTYTGFARGDPMHDPPGRIGIDLMPPCPVALVLEDDAVMVDRFQDRLNQLLEELPRDFHYCALGYAKPKEAPLVDVPGCEHIKLPTMTWYLTGYLLSQSGAQYLLNRLPVIGPIDAWMGRNMILTSNWENDYGHRMGVGDAPQKGSDHARPVLSRKEIKLCMKFRAYCASVPLCDQKVRTATATGASASNHDKPIQNWRLRDSDIVYSGNVGTKNRRRTNYQKKKF